MAGTASQLGSSNGAPPSSTTAVFGLALPTAHGMHEISENAPSYGLYVPALHCWKVMDTLPAPVSAQ